MCVLYKKETERQKKIPSQLGLRAGEWMRSLAVPPRGARAWERTTYAEVTTSLGLAMHFSCSHLAKSNPKNG